MSLKIFILLISIAISAFFYKNQRRQETVPQEENISPTSQSESSNTVITSIENIAAKKSSITFLNFKTNSIPLPTDSILKGNSVSDNKDPHDFSANWKWQDMDLPRDLILPYFEKKQAQQIVYFSEAGTQTIRPERFESKEWQDGQTLFVGTPESVKKTADERVASSEKLSHKTGDPNKTGHDPKENNLDEPNNPDNSVTNDSSNNSDAAKKEKPVAENDFEVVFFHPGKRDDGTTLVPFNQNILSALQGPDYPFDMAGSDDKDSFKKLLSTVVSLGHGGEIMLMVGGNAFLKDKPGFDFVIFENLFRISGTNFLFQEFATVGVSDRPAPDSFKWFECDPYPPRHVLKGCVGAVPTSDGGDQFDLAEVGLSEAKYIWIKDLGKNKNYPSKWPTEGADLDAVRLIHAYDTE